MKRRFNHLLLVLLAASLLVNAYLFLSPKGTAPVVPDEEAVARQQADPLPVVGNDATAGHAVRKPAATIANNNETLDAIDHITRLFQSHRFPQAVHEYALLLSLDSESAAEVKLSWEQLAWQWLEEGDLIVVQAFTDAYLHQYPFDRDILLLKAESLAAQNRIAGAVLLYYDLIGDTNNPTARADDLARAQELALDHARGLHKARAWQPLAEFIRRLLWQDPNFAPYSLLLAKAEIALEEFSTARTRLQSIEADNYYGAQARELLEQIDIAELRETAIPLFTRGEHYVVQGMIDESYDIRLLIDTGASLSVLSTAVFEKLAVQTETSFVRKTSVNTAGGKVVAQIYQVDKFAIDNYFVRNMQFVVMDLENLPKSDGLLGMNFLKHFKFRIDQQNDLLILAPNQVSIN